MSSSVSRKDRFHTTNWTQVLASSGDSPESQQALHDLCVAYYAPVECFVRRYRNTDEARDLTQAFFAKLLEGRSLEHAEKTRGRFRTYLLGAVKHFLADHDDRRRSARRGGGKAAQSLSQHSLSNTDTDGSGAIDIVDPRGFPPDAYFDHQWALTLVERSIETLRTQAEETGDSSRFDILKKWLINVAGPDEAAEAARSLGITPGAFQVAIHRIRKRFRQVVKSHIAHTVSDEKEINDELTYLICALTSHSHGAV